MNIPTVNLDEVARKNGLTIDEVNAIISSVRKGMIPQVKEFLVTEGNQQQAYKVTRHGIGCLKTVQGLFWQYDFTVNDQWERYSVIVMSNLDFEFTPVFKNTNRVLLRIDSGCEASQKYGDLTCDCKDQLLLAMFAIAKVGEGIIINIPHQDGRGMGLPFKLATLRLQEDLQLDTVEAASILTDSGSIDVRTYAGVIAILRFLRISTNSEIGLATNNPLKVGVFGENGYIVTDRLPVVIAPTQHTSRHLEAKQTHLGHHNLIDTYDRGDA